MLTGRKQKIVLYKRKHISLINGKKYRKFIYNNIIIKRRNTIITNKILAINQIINRREFGFIKAVESYQIRK